MTGTFFYLFGWYFEYLNFVCEKKAIIKDIKFIAFNLLNITVIWETVFVVKRHKSVGDICFRALINYILFVDFYHVIFQDRGKLNFDAKMMLIII